MRQFFLTFLILTLFSFNVLSNEKVYNQKQFSTFLMQPDKSSPIIYPLELGHEMVIIEKKNEWFKVIDNKTGLKGWTLKDDFGKIEPENSKKNNNSEKSFKIFKEQVMEMSKSIEEAIGIRTFIDVKHLGGVAATVIADDGWFKGRRHQNQAFQVYDLWKNQNQMASFLSFRDKNDEEKFIILSGPHRPRYLKSSE